MNPTAFPRPISLSFLILKVCQAMVHFAEFPSFWKAIAEDGFYEDVRTYSISLSL